MAGRSFESFSVDANGLRVIAIWPMISRRDAARLSNAAGLASVIIANHLSFVGSPTMDPWNWPSFWDDMARLAAAALLGGVIGLERQWKGHWAGLRTHMMVTIGAAIFVIAGTTAAGHGSDGPSRVIQGVAAGIGFLGAGTILKLGEKMEIKGLTTASSIWLAAALGIAAGLAEYALATAAAAISLCVLGFLPPVEKYLEKRHKMLEEHHHEAKHAVVLPSPPPSDDAEH